MALDNSFSIHSSLQRFLKRCPKLELKFPQFASLPNKGNLVTEEEAVNVLVGVFLHPSYTIPGRKFLDKAVAMLALVPNLRPNIMDNAMEVDFDIDLEEVANVIEFYIEHGRFLELHEHACLAFCRALDMDPSLLSSVLSYFKLAPAPFERFSGKQVMDGDHDLLVARISYRLLLLEAETFLKFWNWHCFLELNPRDSHLAWCRVQISKVLLKSGCRTTESLTIGDGEAFACLLGSVLYHSFWLDDIPKRQCMLYNNLQLYSVGKNFVGRDTTQEKAGCFVEPITDHVSDSLGGSFDGSTGFNHENCLNSIGLNDHSAGLAKLHELQPPLRSQRVTTRGDISVRNTFVLTSEVKKSYERVLLAVRPFRHYCFHTRLGH